MYTVDLYLRVRLACHVDGLSQREAASRFGILDGIPCQMRVPGGRLDLGMAQ